MIDFILEWFIDKMFQSFHKGNLLLDLCYSKYIYKKLLLQITDDLLVQYADDTNLICCGHMQLLKWFLSYR